jgi:hypothetical protein
MCAHLWSVAAARGSLFKSFIDGRGEVLQQGMLGGERKMGIGQKFLFGFIEATQKISARTGEALCLAISLVPHIRRSFSKNDVLTCARERY